MMPVVGVVTLPATAMLAAALACYATSACWGVSDKGLSATAATRLTVNDASLMQAAGVTASPAVRWNAERVCAGEENDHEPIGRSGLLTTIRHESTPGCSALATAIDPLHSGQRPLFLLCGRLIC
jgi:hypothetical protein